MLSIALPFRHAARFRRRGHTRSRSRARGSLDLRRMNTIVLPVLTVATIAYLALTNGNAAAGYELRSLERRADALREEVRQLELASLDAQSIDRLTAKVANQGFIPVAHVDFVSPTDHAVAAR